MDDEESQKGNLKQSKGLGDDDGDWDNFSDLDGKNSDFGGLGGPNNPGLLGAIKEANTQSVKEIDDEFEIDPDLNDRKLHFANNRDNLRQGVSSGFNFKEILNNGKPCSEDELEDMIGSGRIDNPLHMDDNKLVKNSDLQQLWQRGRGKQAIIQNVDELVERLIMREAHKLIDQNKAAPKSKNNKKMFGNDMIDGLDEIEDLDDMDDDKGFHFFGQPNKQPKAGPTLGGQKHSPPALALGPEKVTPLTNMAPANGRKSSSYGKKIGFTDDFDDDWDDTERTG